MKNLQNFSPAHRFHTSGMTALRSVDCFALDFNMSDICFVTSCYCVMDAVLPQNFGSECFS